MKYTVVAETDVGIKKSINQDSVLVKHAETDLGEVILAVVCDGMGGLDRGLNRSFQRSWCTRI